MVNVKTGTTVTITISTGQAPKGAQRDAPMTNPSTKASSLSDSEQLSLYEAPGNLPLSMFANLAEKSEERVLQDIHAGRLLALHLDDRGYRIPDWQLAPTKYLLTLIVLTHAEEADSWAVYRMLSTPTTRLANGSPMEIVTAATILDVGDMVCELLIDWQRETARYARLLSARSGRWRRRSLNLTPAVSEAGIQKTDDWPVRPCRPHRWLMSPSWSTVAEAGRSRHPCS